MTSNQSMLGRCPACAESIPATRLLIEYRTDRGRRVFAECPGCQDVVHPR